MYKLWTDDDGHWYIIPVEIENKVWQWDREVREFWDSLLKDGKEMPEQPEGMIELGCGFGAVHFKEFEINC